MKQIILMSVAVCALFALVSFKGEEITVDKSVKTIVAENRESLVLVRYTIGNMADDSGFAASQVTLLGVVLTPDGLIACPHSMLFMQGFMDQFSIKYEVVLCDNDEPFRANAVKIDTDWAIMFIRIEDDVEGLKPLDLSKASTPEIGDTIHLVGRKIMDFGYADEVFTREINSVIDAPVRAYCTGFIPSDYLYPAFTRDGRLAGFTATYQGMHKFIIPADSFRALVKKVMESGVRDDLEQKKMELLRRLTGSAAGRAGSEEEED